MYDFYYSAKQANRLGGLCNKVRGLDYTECVKTGEAPISKYDDLVLVVESVDESECTYVLREQSYTSYQDPIHWMMYGLKERNQNILNNL